MVMTIRNCPCGAPCGACVQAENVASGGGDLGDAVIAGALVGFYAGSVNAKAFRHLCREHAALFADGVAQLRRHADEVSQRRAGGVH